MRHPLHELHGILRKHCCLQCGSPFFAILLITLWCRPHDTAVAQPVVHFARTLNLLEHIQPGVVPVYGKRIRGFRTLVESSELKRAVSFGPRQELVLGARGEDPPCPFVPVEGRRYPSDFFDRVDWVGNVAGVDISEDNDCECETHIAFIHFLPLWIYYEDGSIVHMPAARLPGRHVLCPNLQAGHLLSGGRFFSGVVNTTLSITLRVADDNMALLADIEFRITAEGR